jgi:hypothetical protein
MLPWGIRNYKVFDQVVLISPRTTVFTSKLWGENLSRIDFNKTQKPTKENNITENMNNGPEEIVSSSNEQGLFKLYLNTFINIWQPAYFKSTNIKYIYWEESKIQKWSLKHNMISLIFYGSFLPFYIIGLVISVIKKDILILFFGTLPIIHSLLHTYMVMPEERYRYPFVFIIVVIGTMTFINLYDNYKSKMMDKKQSK